jgi:hypothetical protein
MDPRDQPLLTQASRVDYTQMSRIHMPDPKPQP